MSCRVHVVPHTHWDREWYKPYPAARIGLLVDRGWFFGQRVSGCLAGSDPNFTG